MSTVRIESRDIGPGKPVWLVAEIGTNHCRDLEIARRLVITCAEAGFDAVKFQTYHARDIVHPEVKASAYGFASDQTWAEYIEERLALPREWHGELFALARSVGLTPFSTPHCMDCARFLADLGADVFKVASMELTNLPFLRELAALGKPIILSLGMGSLQEIAAAVEALEEGGTPDITLTHCVSLYPCPPEDLNLRQIPALQAIFGYPVGFSDHSLGIASAVAAVALGACLIEKHVTLDRGLPGPDHHFALEPAEMRQLVEAMRVTEAALGSATRRVSAPEAAQKVVYRKSLLAARDLEPGEVLQAEDVLIARPGTGIAPGFLPQVLGRRVGKKVKRYQPFTWDVF